ncbi:MAG: flagellar biosynthesis protein FlhB [Desulfobacteraceae bacterium]|nr:flagellar biosynthesis protein FlhB [Desulfobacteraceae bacterium]
MSAGQEKTEQPSGKRLADARNKGQIAKSRDLTSLGVLISGCMAVYLSRNIILDHFRLILETAWSKDAFEIPGFFALSGMPASLLYSLFVMIAPTVLIMTVVGVIVNLGQMRGFLLSVEAMHISFSNLNPLAGLRRLVSLRSLVELVKSVAKIAIVFWAVYSVLWPERSTLLELAARDVTAFMQVTGMLMLNTVLRVAGVMLILSLLDFLYQKWQTRKDLMMTRQEVKEEAKQGEGNPQVKSRIRALQRALARQRMFSKIPKASVIITNPTHFAVALHYKPGMEAPTVVAKGVDFLAFKIIRLGRKHGVPIVQNPPLARALYKQVKLDETIPGDLYRAVAKILAFIYQQKQSMRRN